MAFYTSDELKALGFKYLGTNVQLSKLASIYRAENISIGDNSRIDDFCVLSAGEGGISIGKHVHIAVYCSIIGGGRIVLEDYTCISGRCSIYSSNDDYSGDFMTNPTVPEEFTNVTHAPVTIRKHSLVGAGTVILPGVEIGKCSAVGSLSLIKKSIEPGYIYIGNPAQKLYKRKRGCEKLEETLVDGKK
ncbi:acyltransferase [Shewanella sp. 10N.286.48.B5]|uniref:acyltransferase n=1 Tax=Shewanella sp. 10N.286.48.B5 TaxID=1880834 RepID=UPI000C8377EB|nr:acyltransferase [Shewanella sp. 10N.286.48.B5]PMH84221.1 galactoside O-acetyltransferase [Shewanella sp. 10N.286.48.B5]